MTRSRFLLLAALAAGLAACGVDTETDTGLVLVVTVDDAVPPEAIPADIDTLRFYVATLQDGGASGPLWLLNEALAGRPVDVAGRDLRSEPYRLFVGSRADPPETVQVVVVAEGGGVPVLAGTLQNPATQTLQPGKILERTVWLRADDQWPAVTWTETGCLRSEDGRLVFGSAVDLDCDGYRGGPDGPDCDDRNPDVHPGAPDDRDCDGIDNDCDGVVDPGGQTDADGDGVTPCDGDCDDRDRDVYTGAPELCDGVDNNCNGLCDEGAEFDRDGDGYTTCGTLLLEEGQICAPVPFGDCNDEDPEIHPGASEPCDGIDNNCNGLCDEGTDADGDGFNPCGTQNGTGPAVVDPGSGLCPPPKPERGDCAEDNPGVHPGAPEICDGFDTDCDPATATPSTTCYTVSSVTDTCVAGQAVCTESGDGDGQWEACMATVSDPAPEPLVYCRAWDLCQERADPALCFAQHVSTVPMSCTVHMRHPGTVPCADDPPVYALPFGTGNITNCTWTLEIPVMPPSWFLVGLVDPYDPSGELRDTVSQCEAYLVARPYTTNGNPAAPLQGFLSLEATSPTGPVLIAVPLTVTDQVGDACGQYAESMECTYP